MNITAEEVRKVSADEYEKELGRRENFEEIAVNTILDYVHKRIALAAKCWWLPNDEVLFEQFIEPEQTGFELDEILYGVAERLSVPDGSIGYSLVMVQVREKLESEGFQVRTLTNHWFDWETEQYRTQEFSTIIAVAW